MPGIQAYLKVLNAKGGVNGHPIQLAYNLDDGGSPTTFTQLAHTLVQQDNAFAVFASTFWFTPNLFVQANVPTFGYNVSGNWAPQPNLFAAGGSTQDYNYMAPALRLPDPSAQGQVGGHRQLRPGHLVVVRRLQRRGPGAGGKGGINVGYTDLAAQLGGDFRRPCRRCSKPAPTS